MSVGQNNDGLRGSPAPLPSTPETATPGGTRFDKMFFSYLCKDEAVGVSLLCSRKQDFLHTTKGIIVPPPKMSINFCTYSALHNQPKFKCIYRYSRQRMNLQK